MSRKKNEDKWIRTFEVVEPTRHKKGYTIYKVISKVHPRLAPEAVSQITVWKRYSDFKKLHKDLQRIHSGLYLKGEFPEFAKSKLLGRFEPEIIEERRLRALQLLNFSAEHPQLFTSRVFLSFFEGGEKKEMSELDCLKEAPLQPSPASSHSPSIVPSKTDSDSNMPELAGLWNLPKVPDTISVSSDEDADSATFEQKLKLSSTDELKETDLLTPSVTVSTDFSDLMPADNTESSPRVPTESSSVVITDTLSSTKTTAEKTASLTSDLRDFDPLYSSDAEVIVDTLSAVTEDVGKTEENLQMQHNTAVSDCEYLFDAAGYISQAQDMEADGYFMEAVQLYNVAIKILLAGLKDDNDSHRKEAVRRKTKKYLRRAREVYKNHVDTQEEVQVWCVPLQNPLEDLRKLKVLGIIVPSVYLVMDPSTDTTHVIKVILKSSSLPNSRLQHPIQKLPYMVELKGYYESECAYYLLLQHASGGRLWDYVEDYIKSNSGTPVKKRGFLKQELSVWKYLEAPTNQQPNLPEQDNGSYLQVFSDYVSSGENVECVGLAQCNSKESDSKKLISFNSAKNKTVKSNEEGKKRTLSADEEFSDSGISDTVTSADPCLTSGASIDTAELIAKAQKLLEDIDKTLQETKLQEPEHVKEKKKICRSRSRHNSTDRRRTRKTSSVFERQSSIVTCTSPTPDGLFPLPPKTSVLSPVEHLDLGTTSRLYVSVYLPEAVVKRWAAEIITAVDSLHYHGIICRDLCPRNILLGSGGSVLLSYFGHFDLQPRISDHAFSGYYVAPEVANVMTVTSSADWWSVGVLIYELLTGKSLSACHPGGIWPYTCLNLPDHLSLEARSLLKELLCYEQGERLTNSEQIRQHPFFKGIDWQSLQLAA